MHIVDVHAHLDFPDYDKDREELLLENQEAGVSAIVCNGVDVASNRKIVDLSKKFSVIKPALGLYPVTVTDMSDEEFDAELKFIESQKIVAIGEVGLDYLKGDDNPHGEDRKELMKKRFQSFIDLSIKMNVPIICHSRRAEADVVAMLEASNAKKVVMHCCMARKSIIKKIIDNGWSLSIPCIINKSQQMQENVAMAPMSQILTETDSPYLSADSNNRRNEPKLIEETIRKIAEIKKQDIEETASQIYQNYQRLFL